jgi:uncharacterized protein (UPF0332 family)
MEKIKWCMQLKNGIVVVDPNDNLCKAYAEKAENALKAAVVLQGNKEWQISSYYYAMYFGLYSIMMKIGVKCENHSCSISFMREFLSNRFLTTEPDFLMKSMHARVDVQYYSNRQIEDKFYQELVAKSAKFVVKCKEIANSLKQAEIDNIRKRVESLREEIGSKKL